MPRLVIESTASAEAGPALDHSALAEAQVAAPEASFRSTPLYPRSLEGARLAKATAKELGETANTLAARYDSMQSELKDNPDAQAALFAIDQGERQEVSQTLRSLRAGIAVARAEQQVNVSRVRTHTLAFLAGARGIIVNPPSTRETIMDAILFAKAPQQRKVS